jgi:hypothetical protein
VKATTVSTVIPEIMNIINLVIKFFSFIFLNKEYIFESELDENKYPIIDIINEEKPTII